MKIKGENIGKKFGRNWVFRNLEVHIGDGDFTAITGPNGSGKSTLLQILSGYLSPSEGKIYHDEKAPDPDDFKQISFIGPYIEIPEEMTFEEFLKFHSTFRKQIFSPEDISEKSHLPLHKRIAEFSTGMKQRVQLCTSFYFENQVIFMDEPTSNLDDQGFDWWRREVSEREKDTPFLLASNHTREIELCKTSISL